MWLCVGLCAANLVLLFFFLPESNFTRDTEHSQAVSAIPVEATPSEDKTVAWHIETTQPSSLETQQQGVNTVVISNPTLTEICWSLPKNNPDVRFWATAVHPFIFLLSPTVLWGIYAYGILVAAQIIMM